MYITNTQCIKVLFKGIDIEEDSFTESGCLGL